MHAAKTVRHTNHSSGAAVLLVQAPLLYQLLQQH
jgi:hypothetical protein